ncbi:MAG TPA: N-acetylmuramoyl-L-alanine amidase [Chthoniobacterales bacterium]|nr:N-acetylmuramoyl-L-alanine amidase [Chthoniobacterales bacterium]
MKSVVSFLGFALLAHLTFAEQGKDGQGAFRVCIDPGHPSEKNDGLTLTNGLREASVNWQIAVLLESELKNDDRIEIVLTKKAEAEFVTNEKRAAVANDAQADLFLRLHADAGSSSGFTLYYPRKEGSVHGRTGPEPDVRQRSGAAATLFHKAFAATLGGSLKDNGVRGDEETFIGGRQGALTGSIFSKVPTVLVEMVFLTNPTDAEWIKKESNQILMAKALAAGVRAVRSNSKP